MASDDCTIYNLHVALSKSWAWGFRWKPNRALSTHRRLLSLTNGCACFGWRGTGSTFYLYKFTRQREKSQTRKKMTSFRPQLKIGRRCGVSPANRGNARSLSLRFWFYLLPLRDLCIWAPHATFLRSHGASYYGYFIAFVPSLRSFHLEQIVVVFSGCDPPFISRTFGFSTVRTACGSEIPNSFFFVYQIPRERSALVVVARSLSLEQNSSNINR